MNEIVKHEDTALSIADAIRLGDTFFKSGFFTDIKSSSQAVIKILAGAELGIPAFAAMTGIHIIQGRPTIGAGLIASKVKSSGKYDYKVAKMTDEVCEILFYEGKNLIGTSSFTLTDAKKAQTKNLDKFPKNMLFARAISNGVKWFCPDVFSGPVYTPEDFNVEEKTEEITHEEVNMSDVPTKEERELLIKLVYESDLNEGEQDKAFESINTCTTYKRYEAIRNKLEARKKPFRELQNPSQADINSHLKKAL